MAGPIVRLLSQLGGILGISQGGTGASSATAARENLGLKIGTNVQAYSATLAGLAAATYANGTILSGDGDGIPGTLTLGAGLTIAGSELVCTVSGGGGWSTDGTKTTTTQLVRIGGIEPSAMSSFRSITASDAQTWDGLASFVSSNLSTTRVIAKARGTAASPAAVQSGDGVGVYPFWAYNGSTYTQVAAIVVTVPGTYTTTPGGRMALQVRAADGSNFTVLTCDWDLVTLSRRTRIDCLYGVTNAATDASTVTFDCSVSSVHSVTLGGNRTLALSNDLDGQRITLILKQNGTGGFTVAWWGGITWMTDSGSPPTVASGANKRTVVIIIRESSGVYLGFNAGTES